MWRGPMAVSTEFGPTTGRSGELATIDGAMSGSAVNSDRTWSGWHVIAAGCSSPRPWTRNTSPSRRRAPKTNSAWRTLERSVCSTRGSGTGGGAGSDSASPLAGPAGDGGAPFMRSAVATAVAVISPPAPPGCPAHRIAASRGWNVCDVAHKEAPSSRACPVGAPIDDDALLRGAHDQAHAHRLGLQAGQRDPHRPGAPAHRAPQLAVDV